MAKVRPPHEVVTTSQQETKQKRKRTGSIPPERTRKQPPRKISQSPSFGLASLNIPKQFEQTSASNAADSLLLKLPVELRAKIFKFAVTFSRKEEAWVLCENRKGVIKAAPLKVPPHYAALTCVSRQIYAETANLLYTENTFCFWTPRDLRKWLHLRLPAQRQAIRTLYMYESPWIYDARITDTTWGGLSEFIKQSCPNFEELKTDDILMKIIEEENGAWERSSRLLTRWLVEWLTRYGWSDYYEHKLFQRLEIFRRRWEQRKKVSGVGN